MIALLVYCLYFLYSLQIRSLKLFRLWKAFILWRKHISWRKQNLARELLTRNLFILDPLLRTTLTKVVAQCLKLEKTSFPELSRIENLQLEDFFDLQVSLQENKCKTLIPLNNVLIYL